MLLSQHLRRAGACGRERGAQLTPETKLSWRWIDTGLGRPSWNMAVDEALLEAFVADPEAAPVLRVYGWSPSR